MGRCEATVRLEPSSEWFSGHFDDCPVAPGVALLALVVEVTQRQAQVRGRSIEICGFSRVRFRRFVFPDEELHISVAAIPSSAEAELDFAMTCNGRIVTQGILKIKEGQKPLSGEGP